MAEEKSASEETAQEFCRRTIAAFEKKAKHNKNEALNCFITVIVCTLAAPAFVTLGQGLVLGKIIPSVLSLLAAGATAWLQHRKPQQLWGVYRSAQRFIEDHQTRHRHQIGEYKSKERDRLLAKNTADIALWAHYMWLPLIPSPSGLDKIENKPITNSLPPSNSDETNGTTS